MSIFNESNFEITKDLEAQINSMCLENLKIIQNDVEKTLQDAIQKTVYSYYQPTWYQRTGELLNSVNSDIRFFNGNYVLHVYVDTNSLNYFSAYNKSRNVANAVPFWIEKGHNARNYLPTNKNGQFYNQFHSYEGRHYLEEAVKEVQDKYSGEGFVVQLENLTTSYQ